MLGMKSYIYLLVIVSAVFTGCAKYPGPGGKASIKGSVVVKAYNNLGVLEATFTATDYKILITYGNEDNNIDDELDTSHDGSFEFEYLRPGIYKVFLYSDHIQNFNVARDSVILYEVEITEKDQEFDLGEIVVVKK